MSQKVGDLSVEDFYKLVERAVDSLPKTFFIAEVEKIVAKKFEEERKIFWVPAEQHYNQHKMLDECADNKPEWIANHEFVKGVRNQGQQVYNIGLKLAAVAFFGFVTAIFWDGITGFLTRMVSR